MARRAVLEAPSVLGLFPGGVERLPEALLDAGLADAVGARRAGRVPPLAYDPVRDPASGLLNPTAIRAYARSLAEATGRLLDAGEQPVVLGGDCSIQLGTLLALRRRGRFGLLFLDGHADFYQPEAEPDGQAASMDLALATGRGPAVVADLDGLGPLVRDGDVVALGRRDAEEADRYGSQRIEDTAITVIDLPAVQAEGAEAAARRAVDQLTGPERDGFWVHLDCDVLDDAVMPPSTTASRAGWGGTSWRRSCRSRSPPVAPWASRSRSSTPTSMPAAPSGAGWSPAWEPVSADSGRHRHRWPSRGTLARCTWPSSTSGGCGRRWRTR